MVNNLPPLAGPVDASGEPERKRVSDVLTKHWIVELRCNHDLKTDQAFCACATWKGPELLSVGSAVRAWADHVAEELAAAAVPSSPAQPNLTATLRALAIYCFQKHGNDAYMYNALADLVGPEAMRGVPSSPAQEEIDRVLRVLKRYGDSHTLVMNALTVGDVRRALSPPPSSPVADSPARCECCNTPLTRDGQGWSCQVVDCVSYGYVKRLSAPSPSAGAKKE